MSQASAAELLICTALNMTGSIRTALNKTGPQISAAVSGGIHSGEQDKYLARRSQAPCAAQACMVAGAPREVAGAPREEAGAPIPPKPGQRLGRPLCVHHLADKVALPTIVTGFD